jgi:hypothetical protein
MAPGVERPFKERFADGKQITPGSAAAVQVNGLL